MPRTLLAQAYPPLLALEYGSLVAADWANRAAAVASNLPVAMADVLESCGHPLLRTHGLAAARILPDGDAQVPPPYFVPRGFGAPSGLSHLEHFQWGLEIPHPGDISSAHFSKDLLDALLYKLRPDAEDGD